MCGIAGILNMSGKPAERDLLVRMARTLEHRGPDDAGFYVDGALGFGHRRLSIIDLTPAGHQPMTNEDGSVWVTFNGEIYNYRELALQLESFGHRFRSHCDTEVILHGYEQWGEDCVQRFNGIWAFALWDGRRRRLFCSRDHFGVKPLYYAMVGARTFLFASEIKALLAYPGLEVRPRLESVYAYLVQGRMDVGPDTFYESISQLEPGCSLVVEDNRVKMRRFWDIEPHRRLVLKSDDEYAERFRELFSDSVCLQMRSDAPLGTCLSGGLDSSSIVTTAARLETGVGQRYRAFVAVPDDPRFDETAYARKVIEHTGFIPEWIHSSAVDFISEIPRMVWHHDGPVLGASMYMQWQVMQRAHERGIKVLLDGQGGDELLAGYTPYYLLAMADCLRGLHLIHLWRTMRRLRSERNLFLGRLFLHALRKMLPAPLGQLSIAASQRGATRDAGDLAASALSEKVPQYEKRYVKDFRVGSSLRAGLLRGLTHPLRALLHAEDRSSMAFSIEARVPFLDFRLVEYMFAIPEDQKFRDGLTKVVLRRAMKGVLPEEIRTRTSKLGFNAAEDKWFRSESVKETRDILNAPEFSANPFLKAEKCKEVFERHVRGEIEVGDLIWRFLNLHFWNQNLKLKRPPVPCESVSLP